MSSPFTVTTSASTIPLQASRQGEATFTVTNVSGRPIRGRALLTPSNPLCAPWLRVEGETERDLAPGGTEQFVVQVTLAADAPPGDYTLRLDMVGVEDPDELYSQGPSVAFHVSAPPPQPRPFPWRIAAAAGAVVVLGILLLALWPRRVTVPAVKGMTAARAIEKITGARLRFSGLDEVADNAIPSGQVIRCDPPEGASVKRGSPVTLFVSTGPDLVEVPDVLQAMVADAKVALERAGLAAGATREESSPFEPGQVIRTDPIQGKRVPRGSPVDLVVSKGLEQIEVPQVAGLAADEAERKIWAVGLQVRKTIQEFSDVQRGHVIRTDPAVGQSLLQHASVDLVVSAGPAPTPPPTVIPAYNLFDQARKAVWSFNDGQEIPWGPRELRPNNPPWAGPCTDEALETGQRYDNCFVIHPACRADGFIQGQFLIPPLGQNQHLTARVGFYRQGQGKTNGAIISVYFMDQRLYSSGKVYTGALETIDIDLSAYAGHSGALIVKLAANGDCFWDYVSWVDAKIDTPR